MVIKEIFDLFLISEGMHSKFNSKNVYRDYQINKATFYVYFDKSVDSSLFSPFFETSYGFPCYSTYVNFTDGFSNVKAPCIPGRQHSS